MWVVIYGRHFMYTTYKEYRYETHFKILAILLYLYWQVRYSMSIYPIKYIKIYKYTNNLISLETYRLYKVGNYAKFRK